MPKRKSDIWSVWLVIVAILFILSLGVMGCRIKYLYESGGKQPTVYYDDDQREDTKYERIKLCNSAKYITRNE